MCAVLLVDDNPDTLEMYATGLALEGMRTVMALDTSTALQALDGDQLDAVVTDLQLTGGRNGWDLVEAIRNNPSTRSVPVLVLTGFSDPSVAAVAQQFGCAALLTKPCLPHELARILKRLLPAVA
jgi:CheY-like chemotaxis protein